MSTTQAQRAVLYTNLVGLMGEEAADTMMSQFPPGGWEQMATKEDVAGVEVRLQASIQEHRAETRVQFQEHRAETTAMFQEHKADMNAMFQEHRAETTAMFQEHKADMNAMFQEHRAETNAQFAEVNAKFVELTAEMRAGFAELSALIATGLAEAAKERAEIVRSQARQLYVTISAIVAATISIWIALFTAAA